MNDCDQWWDGLSDIQKQWVHYYFYDIHDPEVLPRLGVNVTYMHDFRFNVEEQLGQILGEQ